MADPDVPWINSNWGSTSGVRFVTADQPTIGIARTIEEYRFTIISPDQGLRGMTVDQVLIAEQVLDHSGEHHAQVGVAERIDVANHGAACSALTVGRHRRRTSDGTIHCPGANLPVAA